MASKNTTTDRLARLERLAGSDKYLAAKVEVAELIYQRLDGVQQVAKLWTPTHENKGPLGGNSSQVCLMLEGIDGKIAPVTVNVYSDKRIESYFLEELKQTDALRELL